MAGEIFSGAVHVPLFMAAEIVGELEVPLFFFFAPFCRDWVSVSCFTKSGRRSFW